MPYVGNKSTTFNTFSATDVSVTDDLTVTDDASVGGDLTITGALTGTTATLTTADNSEQLTLKSTDADANEGPVLVFQRDSSSPADGDEAGMIVFRADDDAGNTANYARIRLHMDDVSDGSEDGNLKFFTLVGGSERSRMGLSSSETVFNEDSVDVDFRVESDDDANMFVVNAGSNVVLVGHDTSVDSDGVVADFQNHSTTHGAISTHRYSANASAPQIIIGKSRSGSLGGNTVLQDGDYCGILGFHGNDGNGFHEAGQIAVIVQSGVGNNDVPADMVFQTNSGGTGTTERMRIRSNGNVNINSTATDNFRFEVRSGNYTTAFFKYVDASDVVNVKMQHARAASSTLGTQISFHNGADSVVGTIKSNGSATQFNTSSDYRLKENIVTDWDATTRLKQLKPSRFNFKVDADTTVDGFLAHEVASIVPEAISGTKDETRTVTKGVFNSSGYPISEGIEETKWTAGKLATKDANGNDVAAIYPSDSTWSASKDVPVYQGIDQSKLVPLLVKTIQELEVRIKALEDA